MDLKNYDCVVNFASETHVDRSIADPRSFLENNVWLVFNVLESARKTNDNIRIIHISTDEVYGEALEGSFDEGSPYRPSNPYSATKIAVKHIKLLKENGIKLKKFYGDGAYDTNEIFNVIGDANQL